jgi:hypothetical protein
LVYGNFFGKSDVGGGKKIKKDSYSFFKEIFLNVYVGGEIKKIIIFLKF